MKKNNHYLIVLFLLPPNNNFDYVTRFLHQLPGMKELAIDQKYGLVTISPKRNLYTIRVSGALDRNQVLSISPDIIKGVYADPKVEPF